MVWPWEAFVKDDAYRKKGFEKGISLDGRLSDHRVHSVRKAGLPSAGDLDFSYRF